jgi:hypothetical protein
MEDSMERRKLLAKGLALGAIVTGSPSAVMEEQDQSTSASTGKQITNPTDLAAELSKHAQQIKAAFTAPHIQAPAGGNDPIPRDDAKWKLIVASAKKIYSITDDETISGMIDRALLRIDANFLFKTEPEDVNFQENQVEELLSSSANLLDRALRDQHDWQDKAAKRFSTASEILEYRELDLIHQDETAAGFYTVPAVESDANRDAEAPLATGNRNAAGTLDWLLTTRFSNSELNNQSGYYQLMAWLAHLVVYQYPFAGNLLQETWGTDTKTAPEFMQNAAFATSWHTFATQLATLTAQKIGYDSSANASDQRSLGLTTRAKWDEADVQFRRRRTQVARWIADLKARVFTEPSGALNYTEQMAAIQYRFQRDLRDAVARIFVASKGLSDLYGYNVSLPLSLKAIQANNAQALASVFDECVNWVRDASAWLVRFSYLDQNYTVPLSVRYLAGKDNWKSGLRTGSWQIQVTEKLFPNQRHLRLRGISAFVVFDQSTADWERDASIWTVVARAPKSATYKRMDDSVVTVDQSLIPPARLGRVGLRSNQLQPDTTGVSSMHNVSPLGTWEVAIGLKSVGGTINVDRIKDVQLDLHVAVRSSANINTTKPSENILLYNDQ